MDVNGLISAILAKNPGTSDLHFKVGRPPMFRFARKLQYTLVTTRDVMSPK